MGRIQAEGCQQRRKGEEIVVGDDTGLQTSVKPWQCRDQ